MKKNNPQLAQGWFTIGNNELGFARAGLEDLDAFYPQICFLCHQAVEKYLKGFLVYNGVNFPKIHDLTELAKLCAKINKGFSQFLGKADILSQYYIVSRYPVEYPPASKKEAEEALEIADKLINFIQKKLK